MDELNLQQQLALQQELLRRLDLKQLKFIFHKLDLDIGLLAVLSPEALAYNLVSFATRPPPNHQLPDLLAAARALNPAFNWSLDQVPKSATVFTAPPRNDFFTAREMQLQCLAEGLAQQKVMAVCGLGGMGKTQTLVEYAHQQRANYSAVLWFGAESVESLNAGWLSAAQKLGVGVSEQDVAVIRQQVIQRLQAMADWLLVFDNVDDLILVREVVGALKGYGHVLLSTRVADTRRVAVPVYLDKMSIAEGVDFLTKRTGLAADDSAEELVRVLDGLPLALEQAAAYIAGGKSFARYLELYQKHELKLLDKRGELAHSADHPDPVAVTWLLSFEEVSKVPLAHTILQQCAFLYADGIVQSVFAGLDDLEYDEALDALLRYSLLKRDDGAGLLQMHRLVQVVVRSLLEEEEQREVVGQVVGLLVEACPTDQTNYLEWSKLSATWLLNAEEEHFWAKQHKVHSESLGILFNQMGEYFYYIGAYESALLLLQETLELRQQVLGKQHPDYAESLNNLAELYRTQGAYEQALPLYQEALEIREQVLGKQHPDYAQSLNNLALLYYFQGAYEQALPLFQEALEITEQVLGKQHPYYYASSLNNLAELYRTQGAYEQALPLSQEALEILEQVLGKRHPDYASSLNNLALLYYSQGAYEQALPLYQEASEIWGEVLGKRHPDYASSLNSLAALYYAQGAYEQALPLSQEALEIREQVLGKRHPDYALSLNNLANLYDSQGAYEQALPLFQEALTILTEVLSEQHPNTQITKDNYKHCLKLADKNKSLLKKFLSLFNISK